MWASHPPGQENTLQFVATSVISNVRLERNSPRAPFMPYTFNGFGTKYYGQREPGEDGSYVTTLWVTALWIPLLPLGSYRVRPVGKGTNWVVHSSQSYL